MKLAVIDCGTNTFNLIIVQVKSPDDFELIYNTRIPVKLGERTITNGYIDKEPYERGIQALRNFKTKINEEKVDKVLAFATSAIRDGRNGAEFTAEVKRDLQINIEVIDGEREAALVYNAVREAVKLGKEISLIMDIGGGSTEFILANAEKIFWKKSFTIGAARLLAKFQPGDPISKEEIHSINDHLQAELQPLFEAVEKFPPTELVGSSGAFESFVEMIHGELGGEPFSHDRTSFTINLELYAKICGKIVSSTLAERKQIKGLVPMRLDMIVICCLLVDFVLSNLRLKTMRMSVWSLKEGAMVEFVKNYTS